MDDMDSSEPVSLFMMIEFESSRRYRIKFSEILSMSISPSQQGTKSYLNMLNLSLLNSLSENSMLVHS
jgi:hypothetical protein